ncbi:MAG: pyruvate dehydrogenase (acetyl-transferring) E1 component subunit alpha [Rhodospirillaceae bacterium]|nr:pyruvate dehydrogenase (acetyl-transferring) E1 component subunit alpha [Rhodospirillaceae bacterium]
MVAKRGTGKPAAAAAANPTQLIQFYRDMLLIRRFEERAGQLYGMGLIGGFCHLYIGQEAVVVGLQACAIPGDSVITSYRDHGHMLACGMDPKGVMAELTGRAGGYSKGKGGSMHMFSREKGFFGGHGIVGAQVPLGAGLAFAHKYKNDGNLCFAYYGDGAANQGQVAESYNMAALWKLPVIFVVENNKYGMGTSIQRASASTDFASRGAPYGIRSMTVDGMSVSAVYEAGLDATSYVRAGNGPVLMEVKTYRYRGHSMSDPAKYRTKEELQKMREQHDPIDRLRAQLIEMKAMDEDAFKALDKEIKDIVTASAEFAQTSPEPDPSELWTDIVVAA